MKGLVATSRTQGDRDDDFMWCVPGELAWLPPVVCDGEVDGTDNAVRCGCGRSFGGLASHRATTTVEVAQINMTEAEFAWAYETSLRDQGWISPAESREDAQLIVDEVVGFVRAVAEPMPIGTLIRRDFEELHAYPEIA
jgi:hypothetical protein